jgi:hypothetical protein
VINNTFYSKHIYSYYKQENIYIKFMPPTPHIYIYIYRERERELQWREKASEEEM